jgi:iron-sulfur cluster repair protein YtfE (RIC family)
MSSLLPDLAPTAIALPSASQSVNDALKQWPKAVGALNAFGIDTCCGGNASLSAAAAEAGVPIEALLAAIARSTEEPS